MWSSRRRNIDHTSHSSKAVQGTEVTVSAGLRKSVFVNRARVRKDTRVTIHVIRGTELPVGCARGAAGNTVGVAAPGPSHGVAHQDVQCIGDKTYLVSRRSYRHIENLAAGQPPATGHLTAVLIDNPDGGKSALFRNSVGTALVVGLSCR